MYVDAWLQLLNTNMKIQLPSYLKKNDNVFQEVVSKDPILKIVVDMNRNNFGLYQHYYKNGKNKTATFQCITMVNQRYDPLIC